VAQGLKQGDGKAPTLFNIVLEHVIRKTQVDTSSNICYKSGQIIGYADDINIVGRSIPAIKEIFDPLETAALEVGLKINIDKTKIMTQSRNPSRRVRGNVQFKDSYSFEVVDEFTYLGSSLTENNEDPAEIRKRITAANKTYFALLPIFKSRNVHRKTKITLYKTVIRTVLAYGCETLTLTVKMAEMLDTFERKVLRRICGPVREGEQWRIRRNDELYTIYQAPNISSHIKLLRLRWAGHVQRMPDSRVPKRIMTGHAPGWKEKRWKTKAGKVGR
jgi:hypothetical protein